MLYISNYSIPSETLVEAMKRFTSGDPNAEMPEGTRLIGRWHNMASKKGVAIIDADDYAAAASWALQWNDLMDLTLEPAVEDQTCGELCAAKLASLEE